MTTTTKPAHKIDATEAAQLLRISRDNFMRRVKVRPDFPRPVMRVSQRAVFWDALDVIEWGRKQARLG